MPVNVSSTNQPTLSIALTVFALVSGLLCVVLLTSQTPAALNLDVAQTLFDRIAKDGVVTDAALRDASIDLLSSSAAERDAANYLLAHIPECGHVVPGSEHPELQSGPPGAVGTVTRKTYAITQEELRRCASAHADGGG